MLIANLNNFLKCRMFVLPLVSILCFSRSGFSQKRAEPHFPVVKFGNLDTAVTAGRSRTAPWATWQQVLSDTRLTCLEPDCQVTGFTISFLPKGQDFRGPYKTSGAELRDETLNMIKGELVGNEKCRIFIEAIHVQKNGRDIELPRPLLFTVTN